MITEFSEMPVCKECGFDLWIPIASFGVSTLGFYNDARFPGRCILMLNEHYDHMDEVPGEVLSQFALDQKRAGAAIRKATSCTRVNYAVLGNTMSHVHAHLIPRYADDPVPTRPPWEHPEKQSKLPDNERDALVEKIRSFL